MRKQIRTVAALTALHAVLSVGLMVFTFSAGMDRFETGAPASWFEKSARIASNILFLPLVYPLTHWAPAGIGKIFSGLLGYLPIILNSLLWGMSGAWLLAGRSKKKSLPGA